MTEQLTTMYLEPKDVTLLSMVLSAFVDDPLPVLDNVGDVEIETQEEELTDRASELLHHLRLKAEVKGIATY
jgi:hypothetical protein